MEQTMFGNSENDIAVRNVARWVVLGLLAFSLPAVGSVVLHTVVEFFCPRQFRYSIQDPASEFAEYTNLKWPEGADVVSVGDDHGGLHGDGEFHLVFDADKEVLERWLKSPTPWGDAEWKSGPIPTDIAGHCFLSVKHAPAHQGGLAQSRILYCAEDFKHSEIPWHNGRILAIDPVAGRVYLSLWDF